MTVRNSKWLAILVGSIFCFLPVVSANAVSITVNSFPADINSDPFTVNCVVNGAANGSNYLRVDLFQQGTSNYFGETNNGSSWYNGSDGQQYFPVQISGETTADVQARLGSPSLNQYPGPGQYRLKIRRYTASGSPASSDDQIEVAVNINVAQNTPTPVATATPAPSPTPVASISLWPTPILSAICQINQATDESGNALSAVKIFLDGNYLGHYTPETLRFCDECSCDGYSCGFGQHRIELQKNGYLDWNESRNVIANETWAVNAVLTKETSVTVLPSLTPTMTIKPTLTPAPTITKAPIITFGEILGQQSTAGATYYPLPTGSSSAYPAAPSAGLTKKRTMPVVLVASGLLLLFAASFWTWYNLNHK